MTDLTMRFVDRMADKVASSVRFERVEGLESVLPEEIGRVGLNIRVPFCASRCTYCALPGEAFNSGSSDIFLSSLEKEIELYARRFPRAEVDRIYLSGGTPSLLHKEIGRIVRWVEARFSFDGSIAMEASPYDLTEEVIDSIRRSGVNQLSIGVQTFSEGVLSLYLGRKNGRDDMVSTLERAVGAGFDYVNVDLMFSLPGQTSKSLADDLETAAATGVHGISTYPLMLLPYTHLASRVGKREGSGAAKGPFRQSAAVEKEQYLQIVEALRAEGYHLRTLWSFTRTPGVYEGPYEHREFIGMGPRAWGLLQNRFTLNVATNPSYLRKVREGIIPIHACSLVRDYPLSRFARSLYYGRIAAEEVEALRSEDRSIGRYVALMRSLGFLSQEGDALVLTDKALAYGSHATKKIATATLMRINEQFAAGTPEPVADAALVKAATI